MNKMTVAPIFSNHMVLQRNKKINVWGTGVEGNEVEVTIKDSRVKGKVKDGQWMIQLPSMVAGGPYTLTVTDNIEEVCFEDVMIGEVWLAGGQSNMEMRLRETEDGENAVANADNKQIRFYNTPPIPFIDENTPEEERKAMWQLCNSRTAGELSAAGYYFAGELAEELDVTVGILSCSWGGTSITCWMSQEYLEKDQDGLSYLENYKELSGDKTEEEYDEEVMAYNRTHKAWNDQLEDFRRKDPDITMMSIISKIGDCPWPPPAGEKSPFRPVGLYKTMLSRVKPYTLKGFIYYQGEEDAYKASLYSNLMGRLIAQWRDDWNDDTLPFIFVQLPMYINEGDTDWKEWAVIRDQQMKAFKTIKNTGIAVMIDGGEMGNIHPLDKKTVGHRLALQGLQIAYGFNNNADAPTLRDYAYEGNKIRLSFNDMGENIIIKPDERFGIENLKIEKLEIKGFEIAGEDLEYVPAKAIVDGAEIVVWAEGIDTPKEVRYAWTNYGPAPVHNQYDLPLAPFTTKNTLYFNSKKEIPKWI
ncbi:MAG TPA: sialate O-acetylesterase [Epulopiscium sp.]|nr:sialate O-acetylesterase [Candidatus Epulonipiscium sp.]